MFIHRISVLDVSACHIWRAKPVRWCYWENNFGSQSAHPPPLCCAKGLSLFCHAEAWAACQWKAQSTEGFPTQNVPKPTDSHEPIPDVSTVCTDTRRERAPMTDGAGRGFTLVFNSQLRSLFRKYISGVYALLCIFGLWEALTKARLPGLGLCTPCGKQGTRVVSS